MGSRSRVPSRKNYVQGFWPWRNDGNGWPPTARAASRAMTQRSRSSEAGASAGACLLGFGHVLDWRQRFCQFINAAAHMIVVDSVVSAD